MATTYSTFGDYSETFGGTLAQEVYEVYARRAKDEIDYRTYGRAQSAPDAMRKKLALCECELVDAIFAFAQLPAGVAAMSNDGLSQQYGGAEEEKTAYRICRKHLTMPVNLMLQSGVPYGA